MQPDFKIEKYDMIKKGEFSLNIEITLPLEIFS